MLNSELEVTMLGAATLSIISKPNSIVAHRGLGEWQTLGHVHKDLAHVHAVWSSYAAKVHTAADAGAATASSVATQPKR